MGYAALVCLALAAAVALHRVLRPLDDLGRPRGFPLVGVVVPLVVAAGLAVPVVRTARLEHRLSAVASDLAGRKVSVHCTGSGEELLHTGQDLGHVDFGPDGTPSDRAVLEHSVCTHLQHWLGGLDDRTAPPDVDGATAVHVLTHEAMHLRGQVNEGAAECAAVQRDVRTARLLGAPPAQARRAARTYWLVVYPTMQDPYRTSACAPGGGLDEGLTDPPWQDATTAGAP